MRELNNPPHLVIDTFSHVFTSSLTRPDSDGDCTNMQQLLQRPDSELLREVDRHGNTALHIAATCGHAELVTLLLERGADTTLLNVRGQTPAECAANESIRNLVRLSAATLKHCSSEHPEGQLEIRSGLFGWFRRWARIEDGHLCLYRQQVHAGYPSRRLLHMSLVGARISTDGSIEQRIIIVAAERSSWRLRAESASDALWWFYTLLHAADPQVTHVERDCSLPRSPGLSVCARGLLMSSCISPIFCRMEIRMLCKLKSILPLKPSLPAV
jgi:hypothetical protein